MTLDIHIHQIPLHSLATAAIVGKRCGLKIERDECGRDGATRHGNWVLGPLETEFYDLNLRVSILDQQGIDMQALSPASSYFSTGWRRKRGWSL